MAATGPRGMKIGAVSLWLLLLLSEKPMYGYEVIRELEKRFSGYWRPKTGTIYPAFEKLEEGGLVTSRIEFRDEGLDRKHYALTEKGRTELAQTMSHWTKMMEVLENYREVHEWIFGSRRLDRSGRETHLPREDRPNGSLRFPRSYLRRLPRPTGLHSPRDRNCPDRDRAQQRPLHARHQLPRGSNWPEKNARLLRSHRFRRGNLALRLEGLVGSGPGGHRREHDRRSRRSRAGSVARTSHSPGDQSPRSPAPGHQRVQPGRIRGVFGRSAPCGPSELHRIFTALPGLHDLRTLRGCALLRLV